METESKPSAILAGTNCSGSLIVKLHPLVVMNVSDHWTRQKEQNGGIQTVYGALFGKKNGRVLEIEHSFELLMNNIADEKPIEEEYFHSKAAQFKQVYSTCDFHGWYSTGGSVSESDVKIHSQVLGFIENPVFLKLDPFAPVNTQNVSIFESVFDIEGGNQFLPLNYSLTTEEAERIGVDHVARVTNSESGNVSAASEHLRGQHSSIVMLYTRVRLMLSYLEEVQKGELPCNHEILRAAHALCRRLSVLGGDNLSSELNNQYNDITIMLYLGVMNKGTQTMNDFINKFSVMNERAVRRGSRHHNLGV